MEIIALKKRDKN